MGSRRFRTSGRVFLPPLVGTTRRSVPPRSSRRNAPRGPISSRSRNLRYAAVSRGLILSLQRPRSAWRLRRPWRCSYGPLLRPAIRRNLAVASDRHLTTSHGPRDEALRNSATPTEASRRRIQAGGRQI
jgi:hypothetical protein